MACEVDHKEDRREGTAHLDDEHDRVLHHATRVEFDKRVNGGAAYDGGLKERTTFP